MKNLQIANRKISFDQRSQFNMADHQQNILMVENNIPDGSVMITENQPEDEGEEVSPDILQQALQEASEGFDHSTVDYTAAANGVTVVEDQTMATVTSLADAVEEAAESETFVDASQSSVMDVQYNVIQTEPQTTTIIAPLGSSQNPIQIIQQGNTYHSTQVLTQEQLQQIAQVLQQQQIAQGASQGGTSVLFNAQTNTRIVYRVIYPAELHAKGAQNRPTSDNTSSSGHLHRGRHLHFSRKRKPWGKRFEEEEEKIDAPDLSKEEKEERKKHRPRTRSGRVSKPPSHMIKDYKRIHTLDFDEDPYDDSDGGYSDFQVSENEGDRSNDTTYLQDDDFLFKGGTTGKPRKWKCHTCDKAYIGRGGLGRHYRLNANHGSLPPEEPSDALNGNSNTNSNSADFLSEDSNSQTSSNLSMASTSVNNCIVTNTTTASTTVSVPSTTVSVPGSPAITNTTTATTTIGNNSLPRFAQRAKVNYIQDNNPSRRKLRLKELIKQCDDEELMEIVMPRLSKTINAWEFLIMKTERGKPARPYFPEVYSEFENLHKQIQKMAQECLNPITQGGGDNLVTQNGQKTILQVQNESIANSLGLTVGSYEVNETQLADESTFQYKLLTTDPADIYRNQNARRTVQLVSPEELFVQHTHKRRKIDHSNSSERVNTTSALQDNISDMPDQILQDSSQEERLNNLDYQTMNGPIQNHSDMLDQSTQDGMITSSENTPESSEIHIVTRLADGRVLVHDSVNRTDEMIDQAIEPPNDVIDQMLAGDQISINNETGEVLCPEDTNTEDAVMVNESDGAQVIMVQNGHIIGHNVEGLTDLTGLHQSIIPSHNGVYILQNADGTTTTLQLQHGDSNIPLETVQALLDMDSDGQSTQIDQNEIVQQ